MSAEDIVIRGAVVGSPVELKGPSRAAAVLPLQRSGSEKSMPMPATPERIPQELDANRELILQEARRAGYEAGLAQGKKEGYEAGVQQALERSELERQEALESRKVGQEKLDHALAKINRLAEVIAGQKSSFLDDAEDDMVSLAFEAFCRVLGETATTREMVSLGVMNAISHWRGKAALEIHVHPDDLQWLKEDVALSAHIAAQGDHRIRWTASADVAMGGCLLRSSEGALDTRLEVQIEALKTMLLQTRALRRAERTA